MRMNGRWKAIALTDIVEYRGESAMALPIMLYAYQANSTDAFNLHALEFDADTDDTRLSSDAIAL